MAVTRDRDTSTSVRSFDMVALQDWYFRFTQQM